MKTLTQNQLERLGAQLDRGEDIVTEGLVADYVLTEELELNREASDSSVLAYYLEGREGEVEETDSGVTVTFFSAKESTLEGTEFTYPSRVYFNRTFWSVGKTYSLANDLRNLLKRRKTLVEDNLSKKVKKATKKSTTQKGWETWSKADVKLLERLKKVEREKAKTVRREATLESGVSSVEEVDTEPEVQVWVKVTGISEPVATGSNTYQLAVGLLAEHKEALEAARLYKRTSKTVGKKPKPPKYKRREAPKAV